MGNKQSHTIEVIAAKFIEYEDYPPNVTFFNYYVLKFNNRHTIISLYDDYVTIMYEDPVDKTNQKHFLLELSNSKNPNFRRSIEYYCEDKYIISTMSDINNNTIRINVVPSKIYTDFEFCQKKYTLYLIFRCNNIRCEVYEKQKLLRFDDKLWIKTTIYLTHLTFKSQHATKKFIYECCDEAAKIISKQEKDIKDSFEKLGDFQNQRDNIKKIDIDDTIIIEFEPVECDDNESDPGSDQEITIDRSRLNCGICWRTYKKPVVLVETGHTFCEKCIKMWLIDHKTCPNSGVRLKKKTIIPNYTLMGIIPS